MPTVWGRSSSKLLTWITAGCSMSFAIDAIRERVEGAKLMSDDACVYFGP